MKHKEHKGHTESKSLKNFQGLFSGLFYTSQLLQRAKTHWEVGFHIKPMSLRPRPTRLHPKLGKKNNIEQHTGLLRWSTSNPNSLNSKDEEDNWWIRTDWSPNHAKYEVTLRRTRRTGRLTVMANFVSFCWPTLAVGLCRILLQVKILKRPRGPLLDIVTRQGRHVLVWASYDLYWSALALRKVGMSTFWQPGFVRRWQKMCYLRSISRIVANINLIDYSNVLRNA